MVRMKRPTLFYALITMLCGIVILLILRSGQHLTPVVVGRATGALSGGSSKAASVQSTLDIFRENLSQSLNGSLGRLFLQLIVVILATRVAGALARKVGQPGVMGEMVAGILLGPSLFGWLAPHAFAFIFPAPSLEVLKLLSAIGVCLFMFVVGMEVEMETLRERAHTALVVSYAGIAIPYALGVAAAWPLFIRYATAGIHFVPFALFMGIATSITAFPVLARILIERRLEKTQLGFTALSAAAIGDVAAWCILAFVVTIARSGDLGAVGINLAFVALFTTLMIGGVRRCTPALLRLGQKPGEGASLAVALVIVLASSLATEVIGIHALFGAFLAGVIMPPNREIRHEITVRIEGFSSMCLLPLFFAFTGLRTQIGLVSGMDSWLVCAAVIGVATAGKLGGTMVAARATGMSWANSFSLGALMNTRGLMELIALNIGYDLGIIGPEIFAVMVLMAITTTIMTGPLLSLGRRFGAERGI